MQSTFSSLIIITSKYWLFWKKKKLESTLPPVQALLSLFPSQLCRYSLGKCTCSHPTPPPKTSGQSLQGIKHRLLVSWAMLLSLNLCFVDCKYLCSVKLWPPLAEFKGTLLFFLNSRLWWVVYGISSHARYHLLSLWLSKMTARVLLSINFDIMYSPLQFYSYLTRKVSLVTVTLLKSWWSFLVWGISDPSSLCVMTLARSNTLSLLLTSSYSFSKHVCSFSVHYVHTWRGNWIFEFLFWQGFWRSYHATLFLLHFLKIKSCSSGFEAYTILPDFEQFSCNNCVSCFHRNNELVISTKNYTRFLK